MADLMRERCCCRAFTRDKSPVTDADSSLKNLHRHNPFRFFFLWYLGGPIKKEDLLYEKTEAEHCVQSFFQCQQKGCLENNKKWF